VFAYSDALGETPTEADLSDNLIFTGIPSNEVLSQTINLPKYHTKVYIRRNESLNTSLTSKDIVNQEVNFNSSEAKTTIKSIANKNAANIDTDGDGILDEDDDYPNDSERAFKLFMPSANERGTIAFEDLWPSTGDYDFNDVAFSYQATVFLNVDNLAIGFDFNYKVIENRAGSYNGIGFEIEGLVPSQIESVTEPILTFDIVSLNPNGTEAGQENAVIILTDAIRNTRVGSDFISRTISVKFVSPIETSVLGVAPFNPFLIANLHSNTEVLERVRNHEVHLPLMKLTNLGVPSSGKDDSDGNYISESGYPWGIHIIADIAIPKDKIAITDAYNFFGAWAESGGTEFQNWYTAEAGNRNESLLK
jgi:LruC domain-containing protein